jgi:hypothetical protein
MDIAPHQHHHVIKVFKSSRQIVVVSARYYDVTVGLLFILGTLAQVGACPKHMENSPRMKKGRLLLGHLLRRPARASKLSWRLNPRQVRLHLELQEQPIVKRTLRSHTDSVFDDPPID